MSAPPPAPSPSTHAPATSIAGPDLAAADLRRQAAVACNAGGTKECLSLLDQARDIDPAGNSAPEIEKLRDRASDQQ